MIGNKRKRYNTRQNITNLNKQKMSKTETNEIHNISNLSDLIKVSKTLKFYKNLNMTTLWKITPSLLELENMIGMESLKETVFYQIIYYLQGLHDKNKNEEYLHTVIYGPPGCGKTTVAKILGKIYTDLNILSGEGEFKVAYREDLISGYVGQTAIKTKKILQSCLGGVLFIDEVYSMSSGTDEKESFSKEAIDTINAFLSEHKNDMCCIIAGYEEEVNKCFFSLNRGLERRFPWIHKIEGYKNTELRKIFLNMVKRINWEVDFKEDFLDDFFQKNEKMFKNAGGDIETFLTKCKMFHSKRVLSLSESEKFILSKDDLNNSIDYIKKNKSLNTNEKPPPEHMYM